MTLSIPKSERGRRDSATHHYVGIVYRRVA